MTRPARDHTVPTDALLCSAPFPSDEPADLLVTDLTMKCAGQPCPPPPLSLSFSLFLSLILLLSASFVCRLPDSALSSAPPCGRKGASSAPVSSLSPSPRDVCGVHTEHRVTLNLIPGRGGDGGGVLARAGSKWNRSWATRPASPTLTTLISSVTSHRRAGCEGANLSVLLIIRDSTHCVIRSE